jgi:hypothetical protein
MRVGYQLGRGRMATDIALELGDGTSGRLIRRMRDWAGLKEFGNLPGSTSVVTRLNSHQARLLRKRARAQGMTTEEWLQRVGVKAIEDDLYEAIVDDAD